MNFQLSASFIANNGRSHEQSNQPIQHISHIFHIVHGFMFYSLVLFCFVILRCTALLEQQIKLNVSVWNIVIVDLMAKLPPTDVVTWCHSNLNTISILWSFICHFWIGCGFCSGCLFFFQISVSYFPKSEEPVWFRISIWASHSKHWSIFENLFENRSI